MNVYDALRAAAKESGLSYSDISKSVGRNRNYVTTQFSDGGTPLVDTAAMLLGACGYTLCAVKDGIVLRIDETVKGESYSDMLEEIRKKRES